MVSVIAGVVRDAEGRPVAEARVYFTDGPGPLPDIAALTGRDGAFALSAPSDGHYVLGCSAEGFEPARQSVTVSGARRIDVHVRLDAS